MSGNEFEKQAQQRMSELQIRPSEEVWTEVEKRIRKEKKRRRAIIWFFLLGAFLLGGGGWWMLDGNRQLSSNETTLPAIKETNTDNTVHKENKPVQTETQPQEKLDPSTISDKIKTSQENDKIKTPQTNLTGPAGNKIRPGNKERSTVKTVRQNDREVKEPLQRPGNDRTLAEDIQKEPGLKKTIEPAVTPLEAEKQNVPEPANDIAGKKTVQDPLLDLPKDSVLKMDTASSLPQIPKPNKNKWEWGITAFAGSSGTTDDLDLFKFGQRKSMDVTGPSQSTGGSGANPLPRTAASPGNGFSWAIGTYAKKDISKRMAFTVGLTFQGFSTRQQTGRLVDSTRVIRNSTFYSTVGDFYLNGNNSSKPNRYYYLQVPLSLKWQLSKGKKFPLFWENGFSFGLLTGSDALVYSESSNLFYEDKRLLNRAQLFFQSGLGFDLFKNKKNPLTVGFHLNQQLTALQKVNSSERNHLSSFGIRLARPIKK